MGTLTDIILAKWGFSGPAAMIALADEDGNLISQPTGTIVSGIFEAVSDADTPSGSVQIINNTGGFKSLNAQLKGTLGAGEYLVLAYSYQADDDATVIALAQAASIEFSGTLTGAMHNNIVILTDDQPSRNWRAGSTDYIKTITAVNSKDLTGVQTIDYLLEAVAT